MDMCAEVSGQLYSSCIKISRIVSVLCMASFFTRSTCTVPPEDSVAVTTRVRNMSNLFAPQSAPLPFSIDVPDLAGRQAKSSEQFYDGQQTVFLDLSPSAIDVYFLRVNSASGNTTKKFIHP